MKEVREKESTPTRPGSSNEREMKEARSIDNDIDTFLDLIIIFDVFNQSIKILENQEIKPLIYILL